MVLLFLVALTTSIFYPPSRPLSVPFLVGCVLGWLLLRFPKPERPLKPVGRGWKAVWWTMVGLAVIGPFIPILRDFVPLLLIVILWGFAMHRYRRKHGVQT